MAFIGLLHLVRIGVLDGGSPAPTKTYSYRGGWVGPAFGCATGETGGALCGADIAVVFGGWVRSQGTRGSVKWSNLFRLDQASSIK